MATDTYSYDPLGGYNITPGTQPGSGAYGAVPGNIQIPPNLYQQIGEIDPELGAQTGSMNQTILSELMGELSPSTIASIQQNAAQFGAASGMPLSQFAGNRGITQLGLNVEKTRRQGIEDYLAMLRGTGAALTPQQLAAEIASRNATMESSPDPRQAADQQMADWQSRFNQMTGGGGGTTINPAGGRGSPTGTPLASAEGTVPQWYGPTGTATPTGPGIGRDAQGNYILPMGSTRGGGTDLGGGTTFFGTPDEYWNMGTPPDTTTGDAYSYYTPPFSRNIDYYGMETPSGGSTDSYLNDYLGFDTTGMSQSDVDLLAYLYGFGTESASPYGMTPPDTFTNDFASYYAPDYSTLPDYYGAYGGGGGGGDFTPADTTTTADYSYYTPEYSTNIDYYGMGDLFE